MSAYKVGPGRPPHEHQFRKGVSGNPKGRPKRRQRAFSDEISDCLSQPVDVQKNGKRLRTTKAMVACNGLVKAAAGGNASAANILLKYIGLAEARMATAREQDFDDEASARAVRDKLEEMVRRKEAAALMAESEPGAKSGPETNSDDGGAP